MSGVLLFHHLQRRSPSLSSLDKKNGVKGERKFMYEIS